MQLNVFLVTPMHVFRTQESSGLNVQGKDVMIVLPSPDQRPKQHSLTKKFLSIVSKFFPLAAGVVLLLPRPRLANFARN